MANKKLVIKTVQFTELTDAQWAIIAKKIDTGRKISKNLRRVINCILKVCRTGCQWRNIDECYGPWQSVYYYFRKWTKNGILDNILNDLVAKERVRQGKEAEATAGAIDSQSIKKVAFIKLDSGIDGNKYVNGRKRFLVVDTLGLPLAIFVCAANLFDSVAGIELFPILDKSAKKLRLIYADNGFRGQFMQAAYWCKYEVEITQKPPSEQGFIPQKGRWQVERSFAWCNFYRRLSKEYEKTTESSVAFLQTAFISMILAKF